ncbi:protein cornichon homolog 4 [Trichonephila clavipes]|uniref:Protein cornichon homolog 4 n=2 Tax=Trichonephila TaxID=2585208 RepID=A0A8X6M2P4_TRICU|nr:protein cornichon homolog 4 [Trichonephila clavata]GFS56044.1 protein cornichon homolog 4 [Trichonephila inaurata madagascariensis]GFW68296.1 protein cornichon homolog 4 [Trichonephila clavipes]
MIGDVTLFVFSLFDIGALLFLTVFVVITLSDLECDYLNAQQCCSKLNRWIVPEMIAQGLVTVLLLIESHWVLFFINLPMTCWQVYKKFTVPSGNFGIYDPTEIHNRGNLKQHMRDSMIRLAFYLLFFFVYLYCMIISLLMKSTDSVVSDEF